MKQRIVYKVQMSSDKNRSKALSTAAGVDGVSSVKIGGGEEKDKVVVIGDEVDIVGLAMTLKKKVGHTSIVSVRVLNYDRDQIEESPNHELALATNYYNHDHHHHHPISTTDYYGTGQLYPPYSNSSDYYYRY